MTDTPDSEFDRWLRGIVHDAVADAPDAPSASALEATTSVEPKTRRSGWRMAALAGTAAAAIVVALVAITQTGTDTVDDLNPMVTTPPATVPTGPSPVSRPPVDTTVPSVTSDADTTAPPVIEPQPSTSAPITDPQPSTSAPITDPPTTTSPPDETCRQSAAELTATLLEARRAQTTDTDCTTPVAELIGATPNQPPCWSRCSDGREVVRYEWGDPTETETADGLSGWVVSTIVEYATENEPTPERVRELWTFSDDDGVLELIDLQAVSTAEEEQASLDAVTAYHEALTNGRWDDAAELLYPGSVPIEERTDLVALFDAALLATDSTQSDLADALRAWCESGALCQQPTEFTPRLDHDAVTLIATYSDQATTAAFRGTTIEGRTAVMGLSPNPTLTWDSRITVDFERSSLGAPGFNEYITEQAPITARTPEGAARLLLNKGYRFAEPWLPPSEREPNEIVVTETDDQGATVQSTTSGLLDDSTEAVRYTIELDLAEDGLYRFNSGAGASRCQPGRGHQDFRPGPCT